MSIFNIAGLILLVLGLIFGFVDAPSQLSNYILGLSGGLFIANLLDIAVNQ